MAQNARLFTKLALVSFVVCILAACVNKPTVYVYAKYLDDSQKQQIQDSLEPKNYVVEFNELDFPVDVQRTTIIYSLIQSDETLLDDASQLASELDMPIKDVQWHGKGNHWYRKNSIAMFLLPKDNPNGLVVFQDLVGEYLADTPETCAKEWSLRLLKSGRYEISTTGDDLDTRSLSADDNIVEYGNWKYRQYPYIELHKAGSGWANHYFEISQSVESDKISVIDIQQLTSMSSTFLGTCQFRRGLRRS